MPDMFKSHRKCDRRFNVLDEHSHCFPSSCLSQDIAVCPHWTDEKWSLFDRLMEKSAGCMRPPKGLSAAVPPVQGEVIPHAKALAAVSDRRDASGSQGATPFDRRIDLRYSFSKTFNGNVIDAQEPYDGISGSPVPRRTRYHRFQSE